jgi:type II secretory pathway component PulF
MSDREEQGGSQGRLTAEETAQLTDQIAGMTRAGLPLGAGLLALGQELPPGRFRRSLFDLASALSKGVSVEQALEQQQERIPPHLRGLVQGGLRSGHLGDILGRFSGYVSIGTELERKLWLSLAYPILSIIAALALFVFVNAVLVGQFEVIFRDFGVPLPGVTVGMIVFSRALRTGWPAFLLVIAIFFVGWLLVRLFLRQSERRSLVSKLPIVGGVWRYTSWAEFCHLLGLLLESHLPLPDALRLTGEGVQHADLERVCQSMAMEVEQGKTLAEAMGARTPEPAVRPTPAETPVGELVVKGAAHAFDHVVGAGGWTSSLTEETLVASAADPSAVRSAVPAGLPRLLQWADSESAMAEILHMAGEMYEARARAQATFAGTVMAVLSVVIVLWGIFTVIGGLILPLITLISKLSG